MFISSHDEDSEGSVWSLGCLIPCSLLQANLWKRIPGRKKWSKHLDIGVCVRMKARVLHGPGNVWPHRFSVKPDETVYAFGQRASHGVKTRDLCSYENISLPFTIKASVWKRYVYTHGAGNIWPLVLHSKKVCESVYQIARKGQRIRPSSCAWWWSKSILVVLRKRIFGRKKWLTLCMMKARDLCGSWDVWPPVYAQSRCGTCGPIGTCTLSYRQGPGRGAIATAPFLCNRPATNNIMWRCLATLLCSEIKKKKDFFK